MEQVFQLILVPSHLDWLIWSRSSLHNLAQLTRVFIFIFYLNPYFFLSKSYMYIFLKVKCSTRFIMKTISLLLQSCLLLSPPFLRQVLWIALTLSSSVYFHAYKWYGNTDISCIFPFSVVFTAILLQKMRNQLSYNTTTHISMCVHTHTHTHTHTFAQQYWFWSQPYPGFTLLLLNYYHSQLHHFSFLVQLFGSLGINNYLVLLNFLCVIY